MTTSRRALLTGTTAVAIGGVLAACGSDGNPSADASKSDAASSGASTFPVTVTHKYGSTTIKSAPKRIVTAGLIEQDMVLALGTVPVAVTKWIGAADGEIYPWARSKLGSASLPKVLDSAKGVPVEQIAALKPDLIIDIWSNLKQSDYAKLSKIAPTVAPPKGYADYGAPWDVVTQQVADAMGKSAEGKTLVANVKDKFTEAKNAHPEFAGKTAAVVALYDGVYVYAEQDPRNRVQQELGFTFPPALAKFAKTEAKSISAERSKEIDFDVVAWLAGPSEVQKTTGGLDEQTTAYKEGRVIYVPNTRPGTSTPSTYSAAFSMVTPLSLPWMLERYVPQLAAAVDGKTSTKVPTVNA